MSRTLRLVAAPFTLAIAALSVSMTALVAPAANAQGVAKIRYQQAFAPSAADLPLYTAVAKGFFKEESLDVQIVPSQDASNAVALVGAGEAQIGISYPPDIMLAREKGIPVVGVWAHYQVNPLGIVSLSDGANIRSAKDLIGKKIGLTPLPIDQQLFNAVLDKAGIKRSQVEVVNPGFNGGQMVGERKLDAASGVPWYEMDGLRTAGLKPVLLQYRDLGGVDFPFMTLIVNTDYAQKNQPAVRGFLRGMAKGEAYANEHPQEALDILIKAVPALDRKRQEAAMQTVIPLRESASTKAHGPGYMDMAQMQGLADFLYDRKLLKAKVDAGTAFTNAYR